jgi:hypothetical protein
MFQTKAFSVEHGSESREARTARPKGIVSINPTYRELIGKRLTARDRAAISLRTWRYH